MGKSSNNSIKMSSTVKYMADLAKGFPSGWRVKIKTRASGNRAGCKYMCYIAPVTGCKFYSKEEVFRYLKSRPKQERSIFTNSEKQVVFVEQRDTVDGLPPGWTLELKFTRSSDGTQVRNDLSYTDPVSGYIFRSKKDVLRYIKTGELGKHAFKAKRDINSGKQIHVNPSPPLAAERQKLNGRLVKEHLSTGQCSKSDESIRDEPIMDSSTAVDEESNQLSRLTSLDTKISKRRKGKKATVKKGILSTRLKNVPPSENQLVENGIKEHENRKTQLGSRKRRNTVELDTPRRISKRLAGINTELVASNMVRPNGTPQITVVLPPREAKLVVDPTSSSLVTQPLNQLESEKEDKTRPHVVRDEDPQNHEKYHHETVEQTTTVEATSMIRQLAGVNSELASNMTPQITVVLPPPEAKLAVDHTSSCLVTEPLNQLKSEKEGKAAIYAVRDDPHKHEKYYAETKLEQTTTVEATRAGGEEPLEQGSSHVGAEEKSTELCDTTHRKIEIEKQEDKKLECDLALPFGELCRDPCLEFAFKTLTGEIPVEDNNVNIPTSDPCLEFAYKTLTGEIPVEANLTVSGAIQISDPCIEFAYKTLTGAIPEEADQTVEIPYSIATSDPCLEFAYKTLTGAIPVEDSLAFQNYFQHRLGSAQNQTTQNNTMERPDFNLNDFQTNNFFHFNEIAKPASPSAKEPASKIALSCGQGIVQHPSKDQKMEHRRR